jgi:hypothetical protein
LVNVFIFYPSQSDHIKQRRLYYSSPMYALNISCFLFLLNFVGPSEAGEDVRRMAEEIEGDLHKLTDQTKERCASLESCLAQIDNYQKVWHL